MQRLRIVSIADTAYVAEAYLETTKAVQALGFTVSHLGVANDLWYGVCAEPAYATGCCEARLSPRPSADPTPWWHAADIRSEATAALPAIARFYQSIIREFRPHVCLIADDQGPLEVFTIRTMNDNHVPVLLLEHGFALAFAPRLPHLARAKTGAQMSGKSLSPFDLSTTPSALGNPTGSLPIPHEANVSVEPVVA